MNFLFIRL